MFQLEIFHFTVFTSLNTWTTVFEWVRWRTALFGEFVSSVRGYQ